jgi:hypothetical protein
MQPPHNSGFYSEETSLEFGVNERELLAWTWNSACGEPQVSSLQVYGEDRSLTVQ